MVQELSHEQKLEQLMPWFPLIIESIKKDLKQEHLLKDRQFLKLYFDNKPISRITVEDLINGYQKAVADHLENVCEFITVRWLLKHSELYAHFERELSKITPNFDEIKVLEEGAGEQLIDSSAKEFGIIASYLFSVFNTVALNEKQLNELRSRALSALSEEKEKQEELLEQKSLEDLRARHEIDLQRIADKYEKKLSGLQRKYLQDTEALKKQIGILQRKLQCEVS